MGVCSDIKKRRDNNSKNSNPVENPQKELDSGDEIEQSSIKKSSNSNSNSKIKDDKSDFKEEEEKIDKNSGINLPKDPVTKKSDNKYSFNYDFGNKYENLINNYEKFEKFEEFYLICPDCKLFITKIESVEIHEDDIKIKYKCSCKENNEKYLYSIIREEKPKCNEHDKEINFICEDCNKQICEECKNNEHNTHHIKYVINDEIISESINNKISEQKENSKGFDIFSKLNDFYKNLISNIKESEMKEIDEKIRQIENLNESRQNSENESEEKNKTRISFEQNDNEINDKQKKDIESQKSDIEIIKQIEPENEINKSKNIKQNFAEKNQKLEKEIPLERQSKDSFEERKNNSKYYTNDPYTLLNKNEPDKIKNYENTKTIKGHENKIVSLIKLNSGYIATGSYDNSIKIWDITKDPNESLISTKHSDGFILCLLELKSNELLAGNSENSIDIFDLNDDSDNPKKSLKDHQLWLSALVKCDENNFASASNDARIIIWDSNNKKKLRELLGHTECVLTMILLKDGKLCSGGADNNIIIWDWKNGRYLSRFKAHNRWIKSILQFNEQFLLTGADDNKIKIWNKNHIKVGELDEHKLSVRTLCKIDDNFFASGSFDNKIKIWDFNDKKCVQTLKGHHSNVICVIKYDDKLISCSTDGTIKIWEKV